MISYGKCLYHTLVYRHCNDVRYVFGKNVIFTPKLTLVTRWWF